MKAKKVEIAKESYVYLYKRFIDDLVVYSCFTLMSEGMLATTWGINDLNAPFIESEKHWDHDENGIEIDVKWTYYLYIPDDSD